MGSLRQAPLLVAALIVIAVAPGCASAPRRAAAPTPPLPAEEPGADEHPAGMPWLGSVERGRDEARRSGKPLFLYWGAVWCPPCRALKAEVFPQPRFIERMRGFVAVHLDGDAPAAQRWAERLGVSSYPAMLVLDADLRERMRILGAVELDELDAALAAAESSGAAVADRIARALAEPQRVSGDEWRSLSLQTWADPALAPPGGWGPVLRTVKQLADHVPLGQPEAAARLAGSTLQLAALVTGGSDAEASKAAAEVRAGCASYLEALLRDEGTVVAGRAAVLDDAADITRLCAPDARSAAALGERLVKAAQLVGQRGELPVEVRLAALVPEAKLWQQAHPGAAVPDELRGRVQAKVRALLAAPIPEPLRHTTITAASDALHAAGDDDGARALLVAEVPRSPVPWYLQGDLASIAAARGEVDEALRWSHEAALSARGPATELQWRVEELKLWRKLRPAVDGPEIADRLDRVYQLIFSLPDGFAGRNKRRLGMVATAIQPIAGRPAVAAVLDRWRQQCAAGAGCDEHFRALR